jgi:hypothetical protein
MADKPRVKAPKQRAGSTNQSDSRRKALTIGAAVAGVALGFAVVAVLLGVMGGGGLDDEALAADMKAAGCTFQSVPALEGAHSVRQPGGTSGKWNTDPPTTGPHYGIAAIFGIYEDELEIARVVHNLEHGGIYILYGPRVPDATVAQLRSFYDGHTRGTILAPLPSLGNKIALGAWTTKDENDASNGTAHLAKCTSFDEDAFRAFFDEFQFQGPERFPADTLLPGRN